MYQHRDWQGALLDLPVSKVVCVGNNYAEHIREMAGQHHEKIMTTLPTPWSLSNLKPRFAIFFNRSPCLKN